MNNIPVDEMLMDLRALLEQFDRDPIYANLDKITSETRRIEVACEEAMYAANVAAEELK